MNLTNCNQRVSMGYSVVRRLLTQPNLKILRVMVLRLRPPALLERAPDGQTAYVLSTYLYAVSK